MINDTIRQLGNNFAALMILQAINYLAPLVIIPYLIRILGIDLFGHYSFIMAVIMYGVIISEYGFDLSATNLISLHRNDKNKINEIFSSVILIKLLIAAVFFIFLLMLILLIEAFTQDYWLYLIGFIVVIGHLLFPTWLFQGIEKMFYITVVNAVSKTLFLILILMFVDEPSDLTLLIVFNVLSYLTSGALAFSIATFKLNISFKIQKLNTLLFYLQDGWYIFTSRIAVSLYQSTNIIILGMMSSNSTLGYYALVVKIVDAIGTLFEPLTRAVYPYLSQKYSVTKALFYRRNLQLTLLIFCIMVLMAIMTCLYAEEILWLISGDEPLDMLIYMLQVLSISLVFYMYGAQFTNMLVILNESRLLNRIVISTGISNVLIAPFAIYLFGVIGLIWVDVIVVMAIALVKGYFVYYKLRYKYKQ